MTAVDDRALHRADGHFSAKTMIRHLGGLSNGEAAGRDKTVRMFRELPDIAAAFGQGSIGQDQVRLLAKVFANSRVQQQMVDRQAVFIQQATNKSYKNFELKVREWERLTDEDGPTPPNERRHQNRDAKMIQDFDLGWELVALFAAMQGASVREIFDHYIDAELQADWENARPSTATRLATTISPAPMLSEGPTRCGRSSKRRHHRPTLLCRLGLCTTSCGIKPRSKKWRRVSTEKQHSPSTRTPIGAPRSTGSL